MAADHRDGPAVDVDATVDITDVYAWESSDGKSTNLVMDIQGANTGATSATRFSNAALYALHITSGSQLGMTSGEQTIICKFDASAAQSFQCWGPSGEYVTDVVGNAAGKTGNKSNFKVAALVREDPFPFNIRGFIATGNAVKAALPGLMGANRIDAAGCPALDQATSQVLVGLLKSDGAGGSPADDFGRSGKSPVACEPNTCDTTATTNGNVLSIVISIDTAALATKGAVIGVWGSTNKVM